jgi:hypothetical protein
MHDSTKILMGSTGSSFKTVWNQKGAIAAGLVCRQKSDGTITTVKADGAAIGVSIGKDLSNTDKTAICRRGERVPLLVTSGLTPAIGAQVYISDTTGKAAASSASATAVNAYYSDSKKTAILEDGTSDEAVHVCFPGGL